jgi:RNA polymerase sigma factor (sigma-70 family)
VNEDRDRDPNPPQALPATLLAETAWVRALAGRLVADPATADDVSQETWLCAIRRPPRHGGELRAWLARLVRSHAARAGRTRRRVARREAVAARPEAVEDTQQLVERVQLQRLLGRLVLELDEPYRSAVLLRWFEDLPPRAIAARCKVPVETVRTRLKRALEKLRERLDVEHGGREAWLAFFVATFEMPTSATLAAAAAGSSHLLWKGAVFMQSIRLGIALVAAIALVLVGTWAWLSREAPSGGGEEPSTAIRAAASIDAAAPGAASPPRVAGASDPSKSGVRREVVAEPAVATPRPAESESSAARRLRGRVLDPDGTPLAGIAIHWAGPFAVRWADSDDPWLGNGVDSLRVDAALVARLRDEPDFAAESFAKLAHAEEWRAALLGEVQVGRGTRSLGDGSFDLELSSTVFAEGRLEIVEPGYGLLGELRGADGVLVLVAAPVVDVGGRVVDALGRPVAGADVVADLAVQPGAGTPVRGFEGRRCVTGAAGRYRFRGLACVGGATLVARAEDLGEVTAAVPAQSTMNHDLGLPGRSLEPGPVTVRGRVVDGAELGIAGARVLFGSATATTDVEGRFALEAPRTGQARALFAVATGFVAVTLADFSQRLGEFDASVEDLVIRLDTPALSIEGRLVDPAGDPLADVDLNVFDPALPDTSFSSLEMLADGTRERRSGADGSFRIGGLAARDYRLRIWSAERLLVHVSEPIRAGTRDLVVRVPAPDLEARVRGRVLDAAGEPVAAARVALGFTTFQPRHGWEGLHGPRETTDAEGRFELTGVPRRHVFLEVEGPRVVTQRFPVETLGDLRAPQLVVARACELRIVGGAARVDALRVLDAEGRPLDFAVRGGDAATDRADRDPRLGWPVLDVPSSARFVQLLRGGVELGRERIAPDPSTPSTLELR